MKKQRTSLFRILILSLVMLVTVFIIAIAWFSSKKEATASGLSVKAVSGLGLECSFNNNEYSSSISRDPITSNFKFPLITGDGTNFFIPALDRSTGIPLHNANGSWISKREALPAYYPKEGKDYVKGDYYVEDIWFQSDKELEVYLTSESTIKPLDADKTSDQWERKSDYGSFSKDNIAGAARVAFFQLDSKTPGGSNIDADAVDKVAPEFIWIPNEKYQLTTSDNLTPITNGQGTTTSTIFDPQGILEGHKNPEDWWTEVLVSDNEIAGGYHLSDKYLYYYDYEDSKNLVAKQMYVDSSGNYVGIIDVEKSGDVNYMYGVFDYAMDASSGYESKIGNFTHEQIGEDSSTPQWIPYDTSIQQLKDDNGNIIFEYSLEHSRNESISQLNNRNLRWAQLYLDRITTEYSTFKRWQVKISFNPTTKILNIDDIILYQDNDHYFTTPIIGSIIGGINHKKYAIQQKTVVITNNTTETTDITYGLNAMDSSTNAVRLDMKSVTGKTYISPQNPLPSQLFAVVKETGGTYKFKSLSTGKFLAVDGDKLVLSATGSSFSIEGSDTSAPMLKTTDGYYITFYNGNFGVSTTSEYASLQIYEGSEFRFNANGSTELESGLKYTYYKAGATALTNLSKATADQTGYLLTSDLESKTKPVVRLTKQKDGNYKAHIRIKIWVEGTDREAKVPLAGGIFSTNLWFEGVEVPTTTP